MHHQKLFYAKTYHEIILKKKFKYVRIFIKKSFKFKFKKDIYIQNKLNYCKINYNNYLNTLIREKLSLRFLYYQLLNSKIYKKKTITYPLPSEGINNFNKFKNIRINKLSIFFWHIFCVIDFLNKLKFISNFFVNFKNKKILNILNNKNLIFIHSGNNIASKSVLEWLNKNEKNFFPIFIHHDKKKFLIKKNFIVLNNYNLIFFLILSKKSILKIFIYKYFVTILIYLISLNWKRLILFSNLLEFELEKKIIYKKKIKHLFLYTQNFHKPLWTFEKKYKQNRPLLFFNGCTTEISTSNVETGKEDWKGGRLSYWDSFYIWNKYHKSYLEKFFISKKKKFFLKDPIVLNSEKKIKIVGKYIVIFPNDYNTSLLGFENTIEYFTRSKNLYYDFFENIIEISKKYNLKIIIKLKKINQWSNKEHLNYLFKLSKNRNIKIIDSMVDIKYLLKNSIASFSMAGTSSAVISSNLGVKTCIYDPTNSIKKNENCVWGLKLAKSKKDLEKFFKGLK
jgi:polysaccharide biosynthesis PFTS motif protein